MSTPPEHLDPLNLKRDEWVQRHLGFQARQLGVEQTLAVAANTTRELADALEPKPTDDQVNSRGVLMRKLATLKQQALALAALAPADDYQPVADLIDEVGRLIAAKRWKTAHGVIARAGQLIAEKLPACQKLAGLRQQIQTVTLALDGWAGVLLPADFKRLDEELDQLDKTVSVSTVVASSEQLKTIDETLHQKHEEAVQRLGRVKVLQAERKVESAAMSHLAKRATSLQLDALAQQAQRLADQLISQDGSADESALTLAVGAARRLAQDAAPDLAEAERKLARELRKAQLDDLAEQQRQLVADHNALLKSAIAGMQSDVEEDDLALTLLLQNGPDADDSVDKAQLAFESLAAAYRQLAGDMLRVTLLQRQLLAPLQKYKQALDGKKESNEGPLFDAYSDLPESLQDPSGADWAGDAAWAPDAMDDLGWHPRHFLQLFFRKNKQDAKAQASEAFHEKSARFPVVRPPLDKLLKKASPDQQQRANALLKGIALILQTALPSKALSEPDAKTVETQFAAIDLIVAEIEAHIEQRRKKARQIDDDDGGHSVKRHGPDVTDTLLQRRLTSGKSPEGKYSPAEKSCRFNSYDDLIDTREAAFFEAADAEGLTEAELFGADRDQPPNPNGRPAYRRQKHKVTNDHAPRIVGSGFIGHTKLAPSDVTFATFKPLPDLTKTYTGIQWNGVRWIVVQHFPTDA